MSTNIEHFDLSGKNAVVVAADKPAGKAIADALQEADANVERLDSRPAGEVADALTRAIDTLGGIDILASAPDLFVAKPITELEQADLGNVMMGNFASQFSACQIAVKRMLERGQGGRIVLVTSVLGERGLPNTSIYCAAHGAVQNFIRALAQEVAPHGISVNGIALGWMSWMEDRLDPTDPDAGRAVRFTIAKRAGEPADIGPMAVWLSGSGVGYVTGQIFQLDGGLTEHL
ncbi:MAG: SDR family oxidoreductase [Gammaproteobacteria bacterium]